MDLRNVANRFTLKFMVAATLVLSPLTVSADETCADFMAAAYSRDIKRVYASYMSGISDIGILDGAKYNAKFNNMSGEGMQSAVNRAIIKCSTLSPSEPLSGVIKVTL